MGGRCHVVFARSTVNLHSVQEGFIALSDRRIFFVPNGGLPIVWLLDDIGHAKVISQRKQCLQGGARDEVRGVVDHCDRERISGLRHKSRKRHAIRVSHLKTFSVMPGETKL